jgi:PAS domain S-box-containing protein
LLITQLKNNQQAVMTKILIVDNTLEAREDVSNILLLEGYQVFQAKDGSVGFKIALKENPDLIISEVVLPKLTGFGMLQKLKKEIKTTNIPLIFLSKKDKKEDISNGINAGAEDYLLKPFNKEYLIKAVKRIIKKQQLNKDNIEKNKVLLKEAARASKIGYWSYDKQSNIRTWSKGVHEVFGTDPNKKVPNYNVTLNYFDKESRKRHLKATLNLTDNGVLYDMEFQITNLKNQTLWIQDIGEPLYNSKNEIIGNRGIIRDITVLKNNQEALKKSNERFEFVALATNEAIWDWDLITGKIYRNRAGCKKVFGFETKVLEVEDYYSNVFVHPDDRNRIRKELKKLITSIDVVNFLLEYRTPSIDGNFIHIMDKGFIIRDKKGIAIRMIGAASDMTKRKKEEILMIDERLIIEKIAAKHSLKSILKVIALTIEKQIRNSFCSILLLDEDGIHLQHGVGPSLPKDYFNLTKNGIVIGENTGSSGAAAYRKEPVFVSDIATDPLWKDYKEVALNHELRACSSLPIISKKGDIVLGTFSIYYSTIKLPDPWDIELLERVSNYIIIAIEKNKSSNILVNSETKYRNLFERNLAGTYQTTINGKILRVNTTFANIAGYESPQKLLEQNADILYLSKEERKVFLKDLRKNKKLINRKKNVKHKDGSTVYLLENCYLQRDPVSGQYIIEGVMIDITEREKNKNELIKAKENAEELADFKDQFLANMSHEIRTPLGIIIGFTKILLHTAITENQKDQLTAIKTSSDTLLVVINNILDLSKIEAGKMTLEKTELKVPDLINTLLSTFKLQLEEREQTLKTNYDKRIPKWLLGDPVRINQILFNLIGNAIKFTPYGGTIGVSVKLLSQDQEKVFIEIIVSDSGIGIPKDEIDKIFNLYTQSTKYSTREYGGSGLGLNIVKQLIDLMKGTILVKSSLGIGSTFTITTPLLKTSITETITKTIVSNDKKLEQLKNIKILIVDDMLINQFLAKTIIQNLGFKSDIADDGEIAIALLEKNDYDIILMDLQMPKMNGWDACMHIRNKMQGQKSRTPIIALSADVSKRHIDMCKEVGMDEYVSKPIDETDLLDKIIRLVTRKNDEIIENQQEATKISNLEYLKDHLNNKPAYIIEMLQMILKEISIIIEQANKFIAAADWNGLYRKIHSIKPILILMGLPKDIIATSKQIEENSEKEEHLDLVPVQFIKLEKALEKAYTELEAELKIIKS